MAQMDTEAIARRADAQAQRFAAMAELADGRIRAAIANQDPVAELAYGEAVKLYRQWQAEAHMTALAYGAPWLDTDATAE